MYCTMPDNRWSAPAARTAAPATHGPGWPPAPAADAPECGSWRGDPRAASVTAATAWTPTLSKNAATVGGSATPPCGFPTAAHSAVHAGSDPYMSVSLVDRRSQRHSSTRQARCVTCATTGTGDRADPVGAAAGWDASPATPPATTPISATAATADRKQPAHAAAGSAPANGSAPAPRSATPATPATSGPV